MLETTNPEVAYNGLNSAKDGTLSGVLAFTGANTHTGVEAHSGAETHTGAETFEKITTIATARTATSDGLTTGIIAPGTAFVTVTSANANNIIVLPAPVIGHVVTLRNGATGYELRSSDPATIGINGGTGSAAESAIGANVTTVCRCVTATAWVCTDFSTAGVVTATEVAAP
jgi:hypothetical protein